MTINGTSTGPKYEKTPKKLRKQIPPFDQHGPHLLQPRRLERWFKTSPFSWLINDYMIYMTWPYVFAGSVQHEWLGIDKKGRPFSLLTARPMEDFDAEKNHGIWGEKTMGITDPPKDMECRCASWMVLFNDFDLWATVDGPAKSPVGFYMFLWFIPTGNPSIYGLTFSYSYQESLPTGAGFRWPIHSMLIADNNTTFGWSPNSAPEFSTSIGLGPKKPMALHDGHRLQQKSRRKSDLKWWPPNQWEFQDPIHWRYLPYIRPIFQAYFLGNIPTKYGLIWY